MSSEDTKSSAWRKKEQKLREEYEKKYPKNKRDYFGLQKRMSFDEYKRQQFKLNDKTSKTYTQFLSDPKKIINSNLEDMLYGGWFAGEGIGRDPFTGALRANRETFHLDSKARQEEGIRGKAAKENAQYTRMLLKQLYPNVTEEQMDAAAAKSFAARGAKQWNEINSPSQIAAAIGKYMPGGVTKQQQQVLDSLTPQWDARRKAIVKQRNAEDDAPTSVQKLAGTVATLVGTAFGAPMLGAMAGGLISSGGDIKTAGKAGAMGYLGGQLSSGLGSMFGDTAGAAAGSATSSGGGFSSYLDDLFGSGYVDGGSVVDLGGSMDDYLSSFGSSGSSIGDYIDGSSVVDLGGSMDDYLGASGGAGAVGAGTGGLGSGGATSGGGSSFSDLLTKGGKSLLGSLFGGSGTSGSNSGLLNSLLSLYGGYQGDKNTKNSLDFLQGALGQYGDPFKDQRNFSTNLWKKSYTNPESLYKEYMSGQGQTFMNEAAAKYAAAGRRNMLPALESQAHRQFYTNYLPQYRQGVDPSKFGGTNANSILSGITNLQGMKNAGVLGGLSNIFG